MINESTPNPAEPTKTPPPGPVTSPPPIEVDTERLHSLEEAGGGSELPGPYNPNPNPEEPGQPEVDPTDPV